MRIEIKCYFHFKILYLIQKLDALDNKYMHVKLSLTYWCLSLSDSCLSNKAKHMCRCHMPLTLSLPPLRAPSFTLEATVFVFLKNRKLR